MGSRASRIAGAFVALALACGLTVAGSGTARADGTVPNQPWTEVVPAFTDNVACLDDPNGSATSGTSIQLWHCHGYATNGGPQRWIFSGGEDHGSLGTGYLITSHNLCLDANGGGPIVSGARVTINQCQLFGGWLLHPRNAYSGDPLFTLELGLSTGECLALPDFSGGNGEPVIIKPCNSNDELQLWTAD
jgi:hypothetical protein